MTLEVTIYDSLSARSDGSEFLLVMSDYEDDYTLEACHSDNIGEDFEFCCDAFRAAISEFFSDKHAAPIVDFTTAFFQEDPDWIIFVKEGLRKAIPLGNLIAGAFYCAENGFDRREQALLLAYLEDYGEYAIANRIRVDECSQDCEGVNRDDATFAASSLEILTADMFKHVFGTPPSAEAQTGIAALAVTEAVPEYVQQRMFKVALTYPDGQYVGVYSTPA